MGDQEMNNRVTMCLLLSGALVMAMCYAGWAQETVDARMAFNTLYVEWKEYLRNMPPEVIVHSSLPASTLYDNEPFRKIVALGAPALPYIVDGISKDRLLVEAFFRITKWQYHVVRTGNKPQLYRWTIEEFPEMSTTGGPPDRIALCNKWWEEGRFRTGERFAELYGKWKSLKAEKKDKEAEETYQRIVELGIPVLPHLLDKVEQEPEFVPAISKLSDGELAPRAKAIDCKDWWEKNKQKFELPNQSVPKQPSNKK